MISKKELSKARDIINQSHQEEEDKLFKEKEPEIMAQKGTCYRYRNSYSCPSKPEDYWWFYKKIVDVIKKDKTFYRFSESFQMDSYKHCKLETEKW